MFRNSNTGKLSFSWNRLILNSIPNFASDSKGDVELSPKEQDELFRFQILQPNPRALNEQSFYIGGVVDSPSISSKVIKSLQKVSIVIPTTPYVDTTKITRHFSNQVPSISVHRQRKLIALLFFWEEELTRWRLLDEEENEIQRMMKEAEEVGDIARPGGGEKRQESDEGEGLKVALSKVVARRVMAPGLRRHEGTGDLPGYEDRSTVGVGFGSARS